MRLAAGLLAAILLGRGEAVLGQERTVERTVESTVQPTLQPTLPSTVQPTVEPAGELPAESTLVWLCPEHRDHPQEEPGACALCGRPRAARRLATLWSCPMHPQVTSRATDACPVCGMTLVSTTQELEWFCAAHPDVERPEPGACPRDGTALSLRGLSMPHGDHNPRHGGLLFMAADRFHHLEGALGPDRTFRLFFYDDFTRPLDARAFRARVEEQEMQPSTDGTSLALATFATAAGPIELTVRVRFPSSEREERFDFVMNDEPNDRASPKAAGAAVASPSGASASGASPSDASASDPSLPLADAAGLLDGIRDRSRRVDDLVRRGAWPGLFIPALEAKDLALALLEREGDRVALPVKTLVRAAWLLDLHGDLGKRQEVEAAQRLFAQGMADLEKAYAR